MRSISCLGGNKVDTLGKMQVLEDSDLECAIFFEAQGSVVGRLEDSLH
jgi:hypothetical protein